MDNCPFDEGENFVFEEPILPKLRNFKATPSTENSSFIKLIWNITQPSEIIIKTSVFLPVVIWGLGCNLALIYVIAQNRHLRSPTNLLVGNMAVADLLSLLIHPWVFLVYDFFQNYQLGAFGCRIEGAIECSLLLASVMNLAAISYDRLTAIVLPRETRLTRNGAKIVMAVTWLAGVIFASPLFFYRSYTERIWLDFTERFCSEDLIVSNIYWHVIITMMVWFPMITMMICYITIFIKLARYQNYVRNQTKSLIQVRYKAKVAKTMFIVVIAFIICHVPFSALIFYRNHLIKGGNGIDDSVVNRSNSVYQALWFISKLFLFVNAGLNPVIYGIMNDKFRKVFRVTPVIKWIFMTPIKKIEPGTKDTVLADSKEKPKVFSIFQPRSPTIGNRAMIAEQPRPSSEAPQ